MKKATSFKNYTGERISFYNENGLRIASILPSGKASLYKEVEKGGKNYEEIVIRHEIRTTLDLPDPVPGLLYIVSDDVRIANLHRDDLASPAYQLKILGMRSLDMNAW
ncbi:MAG: hypothetical protein AB9915_00090 [Candidatus Dojkabacteria bacterium]